MKPLFIVSGIVSSGKKRGKELGFPTANFPADPSLPQGTYISMTYIHEKNYPSMTFIGRVETFDENDFVVETNILNFNKDLYR